MSKDNVLKPSSTKNVEIKLDILHNDELQSELRTLKELFEASYGPTGRTSLIQHHTGGHVTVTSSASQILKNITTVSTPLTRLLLQAVQGHLNQFNDGGLFTAFLALQLIDSSITSGLARHTAIAINELALTTILKKLENSHPFIKLPADLGNMDQMLCVIRSILATKPASGLSTNEIQSLAVLLLRGFLSCVPTADGKTVSLDNLRIQGCEGPPCSESCLKKGILLEAKCPPITESSESKDDIKVALFDCSLAGNVEDRWLDGAKTELSSNVVTIEDNVLTLMKMMVDDLVKHGVKLIACQKVIHPTLQQHITRKGVHVIERLSIDYIDAVQKLTGARLFSSFQCDMSAEGFGSLAEVKSLVLHKRRFVHLIPHSSLKHDISTLLLCGPDEHSLDELKILCCAVFQSLKQLVYNPFLVPGGGCFETMIAGLLMQAAAEFDSSKEVDCSKYQFSKGLHSVASTFFHIARTLDHDGNNHLVDRTTFHHWVTPPLATVDTTTLRKCLCGLVTSTQDMEWNMTEELRDLSQDLSRGTYICRSLMDDVKNYKHAVLDVMSMKANAMMTAFETANTILRIKHFIKETFE
ncbi:McKusick-Kaufman/Bardet-Biedl syndromes putative chaperonin-like [Dendronephthya gigantea]|uniref:McKusick-Kaufman/Bardet-Biedl syndromes putative chaperonin-like n=1 Tax=Dendronephthya gigantea TaxID=151771 RepID=UPI00106D51C4|nr:McKusick-Kaufman/Bardet-Biedl syndromes putative chaperonin-like [Dendronephthya gigantea]